MRFLADFSYTYGFAPEYIFENVSFCLWVYLWSLYFYNKKIQSESFERNSEKWKRYAVMSYKFKYRVWNYLRPPPSTASTTNISRNLHIQHQKIANVGLFWWTCLISKNTTKLLIFLTKRTKISTLWWKLCAKNFFSCQSCFVINYLKA